MTLQFLNNGFHFKGGTIILCKEWLHSIHNHSGVSLQICTTLSNLQQRKHVLGKHPYLGTKIIHTNTYIYISGIFFKGQIKFGFRVHFLTEFLST